VHARLDVSALPRAAAPSLDAEQRRVVEHRDGPLLVLAGPGTGKTTTIVESVVARLTDGQPPEQILVLTFGRRAAGELRDRIAARCGGGLLPQVATFHAFAYGLVRSAGTAQEYVEPPRLLSGAEEDQRIRDLIRGTVEDGSVRWPEEIREALTTHGFAVEVRTLIARMRERGVTPDQLRGLAIQHERPSWAAVADIAEQEADVMVLENVMDYAELMRRAVLVAGEPRIHDQLHNKIRAIYVDEFQDTDPLQVELLRAIAGPQACVVAVGDPDQAIYAFRGADVHGILEFPGMFPQPNGEPAEIIALRTVRRFGHDIARAAQATLAAAALPGLPAQAQRLHRTPVIAEATDDHDQFSAVEVLEFPSSSARDLHVAEHIRACHVHDKVDWRDMAVLVRASGDLAGIERALNLAGVPAAITADEIPLRAEPAVAYVLTLLEVAADPSKIRTEKIIDLLAGPIGRIDVSQMRVLGRALRAARRLDGQPVLAARELIRSLILEDEPLPGSIEPNSVIGAGVQRVRGVIETVRARIQSGAPIADVLWAAWTGGRTPHQWPDRLRTAALAGSQSAHHDLDAVIALFDTADRISERYRGVYGVSAFLASLRDQAIPAESIAGASANQQSNVVRIMTVHRAKGLEWNRVWVLGLQEGVWPNLIPRGSLLGVQELEEAIDAHSETDQVVELVREERNLLYVACTRAKDQLTLTTISADESGDERPSRFVDDLARAGFNPQSLTGQAEIIARWSTLVAELRLALLDPQTPESAQHEAAQMLAVIAKHSSDNGEALVPTADPRNWWGVADISQGPVPLRDEDEPIALSGSSLDAVRDCTMKWFLDHEVHAETIRGGSTAFGSIVHAIADHVAQGEVPEDIEAMDALVDRVWSDVDFEARWRSSAERAEARRSLERFLRYHQAAARDFVGTEKYLEALVDVPMPGGGTTSVKLRGFIDRIERDTEGRLVAIDLKTNSTVPTKNEVAEHGQLGVYQLLLREDAAGEVDIGGAALIQLRKDMSAGDRQPKEQFQEPLQGDVTWIERSLGQAAAIIRSEDIVARVGKQCNYCAFTAICPAKNPQVSVVELGMPGSAP
jgi:superfamily I DNA/RNA helicase/RecB family exonuclease